MFSLSKETIEKMRQSFDEQKAKDLKELDMRRKELDMRKKELEKKEFNAEDFLKQQQAESMKPKQEEEMKSDLHFVFHFLFDLLKIVLSLAWSSHSRC